MKARWSQAILTRKTGPVHRVTLRYGNSFVQVDVGMGRGHQRRLEGAKQLAFTRMIGVIRDRDQHDFIRLITRSS